MLQPAFAGPRADVDEMPSGVPGNAGSLQQIQAIQGLQDKT